MVLQKYSLPVKGPELCQISGYGPYVVLFWTTPYTYAINTAYGDCYKNLSLSEKLLSDIILDTILPLAFESIFQNISNLH